MHTTVVYSHQVSTGVLTHVHDRLLSAYVNAKLSLSANENDDVQVYEGISLPFAKFTTSTCNVSPTLLARGVDELLRTVPAADSQLSDADIMAPGFTRLSSPCR